MTPGVTKSPLKGTRCENHHSGACPRKPGAGENDAGGDVAVWQQTLRARLIELLGSGWCAALRDDEANVIAIAATDGAPLRIAWADIRSLGAEDRGIPCSVVSAS